MSEVLAAASNAINTANLVLVFIAIIVAICAIFGTLYVAKNNEKNIAAVLDKVGKDERLRADLVKAILADDHILDAIMEVELFKEKLKIAVESAQKEAQTKALSDDLTTAMYEALDDAAFISKLKSDLQTARSARELKLARRQGIKAAPQL